MHRFVRSVAPFLCLSAAPACADVTGEIALLSDYRFRGVSLSDGNPSLQGSLDWSSAAGWFAGIVASTVKVGRTDPVSGIGAQGYAGYNGALTSTLAWSGGLSAYAFPSTSRGSTDYQELFVRVGSDRWQTGLYLSPDYYGNGAPSAYASFSASRPLASTVTAFAQAGWLVTGRPNDAPAGERPQRFDGRLGLAWDFGFAIAEASVVGVTRDNDRCRADPDVCKATVVIAFRKAF